MPGFFNSLTVFRKRGMMARTDLEATPQLRAMFALHKARQFRHFRDCHCGKYGGTGCTAADAMWTRAMDRELENLSRT